MNQGDSYPDHEPRSLWYSHLWTILRPLAVALCIHISALAIEHDGVVVGSGVKMIKLVSHETDSQ